MAIIIHNHQHQKLPRQAIHHRQRQQRSFRKSLTKGDSNQIFRTRPSSSSSPASLSPSSNSFPPSVSPWTAAAVICILISSAKIVAGNAIPRNIDGQSDGQPEQNAGQMIIINGTAASAITAPVDDLSNWEARPRPQKDTSVSGRDILAPNVSGLNYTVSTSATSIARDDGARATTYSYFYLGRKLIYVPLFFLLYWTVYNAWLLLEAIAFRKRTLKKHWRPSPYAKEGQRRKRALGEEEEEDELQQMGGGVGWTERLEKVAEILQAVNNFKYK